MDISYSSNLINVEFNENCQSIHNIFQNIRIDYEDDIKYSDILTQILKGEIDTIYQDKHINLNKLQFCYDTQSDNYTKITKLIKENRLYLHNIFPNTCFVHDHIKFELLSKSRGQFITLSTQFFKSNKINQTTRLNLNYGFMFDIKNNNIMKYFISDRSYDNYYGKEFYKDRKSPIIYNINEPFYSLNNILYIILIGPNPSENLNQEIGDIYINHIISDIISDIINIDYASKHASYGDLIRYHLDQHDDKYLDDDISIYEVNKIIVDNWEKNNIKKCDMESFISENKTLEEFTNEEDEYLNDSNKYEAIITTNASNIECLFCNLKHISENVITINIVSIIKTVIYAIYFNKKIILIDDYGDVILNFDYKKFLHYHENLKRIMFEYLNKDNLKCDIEFSIIASKTKECNYKMSISDEYCNESTDISIAEILPINGILSYNISWATQQNKQEGSEWEFVKKCAEQYTDSYQCSENSSKIIIDTGYKYDLDIIGLQECVKDILSEEYFGTKTNFFIPLVTYFISKQYRYLPSDSIKDKHGNNVFNVLIYSYSTLHEEPIYNGIINLDKIGDIRIAQFVYFLKNKLLIVNCHFPHVGEDDFVGCFNQIFNKIELMRDGNIAMVFEKIIIFGDFNKKIEYLRNIELTLKYDLKIRNNLTTNNSCCWPNYTSSDEVILDNFDEVRKLVRIEDKGVYASDHMPVLSIRTGEDY